MQWWTEFSNWLNSNDGGRVFSTIVIPFVAIVVAGIVAAVIGRASARKVIELSEREVRASAVTALISAARKAAVWNSLATPEQQHIDHLISDAEIRLRLLPVAGTSMAADWASHEIVGMKRNAVSFSFQAEQSLLVFRDRLIEWQARPGRAKKLFKNDLESWSYDSSVSEQELVHQQQAWVASQVTASKFPAPSSRTAATTPELVATPELVVAPVLVVAPEQDVVSAAATHVIPTASLPIVSSSSAAAAAARPLAHHTAATAVPAADTTVVAPDLVEPETTSARSIHDAAASSHDGQFANADEVDEPTEYLADGQDEGTSSTSEKADDIEAEDPQSRLSRSDQSESHDAEASRTHREKNLESEHEHR